MGVTRRTESVPGIEHVASKEEFAAFVRRRIKEGARRPYDVQGGPRDEEGARLREERSRLFPRVTWGSALAKLEEMRWGKSAGELAELRRVGWASAAAMRAGMRGIRPGRTQREAEAEVVSSCIQNGAEGQSFWPWIMSGPNGVYPAPTRAWLYYHFLDRTMQAGELVYLDLGCARAHYEGDLGRTVPVSGKFTPEQREVWELLVRAYGSARAAIRPGATLADVKKAYYGVFQEARQKGQMKSDLARAAVDSEIKEGEAGEMFLVHGVGIDPVEKDNGPLVPGVVLALEP